MLKYTRRDKPGESFEVADDDQGIHMGSISRQASLKRLKLNNDK